MKKSRFKNLHDYLALLVRRRWWVIIPAVALCGLSILLTLVFPKMYRSQTMILIQQRDVPDDFVKDLIGENIDERLKAIEQTILSRTNLLRIVNEFESRLPEYRSLNDERKVEKLRKRIAIDFPTEKRAGRALPVTNIIINYSDRTPDLAQKIAARLASLFIEQDNRARENKVFGTAEFLEAELKKVADQLHESETRLSALKQRYRFEMPTELDTNLRTLDRLQIQKNGNLEALDRFVTLQMNLERQISETPAMIPSETSRTAAVVARNPKVEVYLKKEQEYQELIIKAKPTHPDVRRLKAELDQLKKEIPPEDLDAAQSKDPAQPGAPAMMPNPVYQSLTAQLRQLKTDIAIREKEKKWIEDEMAKYNRRIQNTPGVEQEMLTITRANQELIKQHEDLKSKLEQARLAGSLESRQKGAQFEIIDPANYPMEPSPPQPIVLLLAGFAISIAAGVAAAFVVDMLNQRVWTHQELERALEAPVLVEIPSITDPGAEKKVLHRRILHAAMLVVFTGVYLGGLYYLYVKQSALLRLLDPLIEKIAERAAG
ncbi:MAG: Wzz/FepE/Etk N-terminal domain-containing protein [Acidobacteriota bacterium]|nr:Wzz/FepE/Etk N-terminal domain-containing protein [Acidobacteriota bacterium]